jgi:hypothetical protein
LIPAVSNSLWLAACLPEFQRFCRATRRAAREQQNLLHKIVSANTETEFGWRHNFAAIRSVADYQRQVPLRDYSDYQGWIDQVAAGGKNILTHEAVRLFEPTSGSTTAAKMVPYTRSLQQQFRRGIQAWIADLFLHDRQLMTGPAYWSVSPAVARGGKTAGGIPIGFNQDAAYLGGWQQRLVDSVMAVPGGLARIPDMDTVRYLTLLFLIRSRRLKLASVWNPTFLSLLLDRLPEWAEQIASDLENGTISRGSAFGNAHPRPRPDPERARELRGIATRATAAERHSLLWPGLRLISCWTDANAAAPATLLQAQFPQSQIQGKGLIATEAFVSIPLTGHDGAALALRSHFFEFLPFGSEEKTGPALLAHEIEKGRRYAVVVTTGGGLYRYRLGDLVEVTGYFHGCPLIRFVGRCDHVSDWFGEKLNEVHVSQTLGTVFREHEIAPTFAMLACDTRPVPAYVLYIENDAPDRLLQTVADHIEEELCHNFHYRYARRLGQLAPLRIFRARQAAASYLETAIASGQAAGDVKPQALDRRDIWWKVFRGTLVNPGKPILRWDLGISELQES